MKNFIKTYNIMLLEHINDDKNINIFTKDELIKALKTCFKSNDQDEITNKFFLDKNILTETINHLIKLIETCKSGKIISHENLNLYLNSKNFRYFNLIDKCKDIKILKCDFKNYDEIFQIFKNTFYKFDKDFINEYTNTWINEIDNCQGVCMEMNENIIYIFLNTKNHFTKYTIYHELIHYFQKCLKKYVDKFEHHEIDLSKLDYLKLDEHNFLKLQEIIRFSEIYPYISELSEILNDIHKKFKKFSKKQYFEFCVNVMKSSNIFETELFKEYLKITEDISPLLVFIFSYVYDFNYKNVKKYLYERMINEII